MKNSAPVSPPSEPPVAAQFTERTASAIVGFMLADAEFRGWEPNQTDSSSSAATDEAKVLAEKLADLKRDREDAWREALRWKAVAEDLGGLGYDFRCSVDDCDNFATEALIDDDDGETYLCPEHAAGGGPSAEQLRAALRRIADGQTGANTHEQSAINYRRIARDVLSPQPTDPTEGRG